MLLEMHLRSKDLSNNSTTAGFVWEEFDFEACNDFKESKYIWAVGAMLCFALGFPASIVILWEMLKTHRRGTPLTPYNFFILNLTIMDVVFLTFIPPGLLNNFIWKTWAFEAIWNGVYAMSIWGRPLLMACVCLDCYLAVVHPITYHKRKSLTPRFVIAGIVWTLTLAAAITYCLYYKLFLSIYSSLPFIIAIVIIGISDFSILYALVKSDPGRKNIHPQKQRAVQTLINSLVITVFTYLPPVLLITIGGALISNFNAFLCSVGVQVALSSTSGSAIMPILYLHNSGKLNCFRLGCCRKY